MLISNSNFSAERENLSTQSWNPIINKSTFQSKREKAFLKEKLRIRYWKNYATKNTKGNSLDNWVHRNLRLQNFYLGTGISL